MSVFLEFIQKRKEHNKNIIGVNEAFKTDDVDTVLQLITKLFKNKIGKDVIMIQCPVATIVDGKDCISITFIKLKDKTRIDIAWNFNYLVSGKSSEVYSIDFFEGEEAEKMLFVDNKAKTALSIYTMGQSVAYFLPLVITIAKTKNFNITKRESTSEIKKVFANECRVYYHGAQAYVIHENLDDRIIENAFHISQGHHLIDNGEDFIWETEAEDIKRKVRAAERESWKTKHDSAENRQRSIALDREYREICKAINGGATTLKDIEMSIGHKVSVTYDTDPSIAGLEKKISEAENKYNKSPEQAFKEMQAYVKTVLQGLQSGLLLCGAPGVGKTYRVLQQLKANKYVNGQNMTIIKGKCTPRQMYLALYEYRHKGNIILIDDADSLIGPKAPEDVINILKAALDTTADDEGRLVSYKVSGKLTDNEDEVIPKEHYFNGSIIIITNYSPGQIDSAIRNRCFIQSLSFSTKQLLDLIKTLLPGIAPNKLSQTSKIKAYDYLKEMAESGSDMEISIRSFSTCARIFMVCEGDADFRDEDAKSMITEQMKLQSLRGGRKF